MLAFTTEACENLKPALPCLDDLIFSENPLLLPPSLQFHFSSIMHKRLRIDPAHLPPQSIPTNTTVPATPPPLGNQTITIPLPGGHAAAGRQYQRARADQTPEDKVKAILERDGKSFCEELGVSN